MKQNFISVTPIKNIEEIHHIKNIVRDNGDDFFTNLYVNDNLLSQWILRGQIYSFSSLNSIFVLRLRKEFWHLYFGTNDLDIFSKEIFCLTEKMNSSISVDLIHRDAGGERLKR